MHDFLQFLSPLRRKLTAERFLKQWLQCLVVGLVCDIVIVIVSKFVRIPYLMLICACVLCVTTIIAMILTVVHRPTMEQTAETADALGGAERMITTLELLKQTPQNTVEHMAVADGMETAKKTDFAKLYPFCIPKKLLAICMALVMVFVGSGFIPIQRDETAKVYADAQIEKIEEIEQEVKEEMTEEEQKQFSEVTEQLKEELSQSKTEQQAQEAVKEAQQEMKQLEKESVSEDLQALSEALQSQPQTESLGQQLSQGDSSMIEEIMEQLAEELSNMSEQQKQELAEQLQQSLSQMQNEQMQQATSNLSNALQSGQPTQQALSQLSNAAQQQAQQGEGLRNGLQQMNEGLGSQSQQQTQSGQSQQSESQSGQNQSGQNQQSQSQSEQNGESQQGESPSTNGQTTQSDDMQNGTGGGQQPSTQGNGTGGGQGSSGQGNGTGSGRGEGKGNAEEIYTRTAADKQGYDAYLQGQDTGEGETNVVQGSAGGGRGESVPYQEVYQQYRQEAVQQLSEQNVPYGMRELVSNYFATLEQ